jgi:hypothetical protein
MAVSKSDQRLVQLMSSVFGVFQQYPTATMSPADVKRHLGSGTVSEIAAACHRLYLSKRLVVGRPGAYRLNT